MKRNMDLARSLLQHLEEDGHHRTTLPSIEGYSEAQVRHHLEILTDAGLVQHYESERDSEFEFSGANRMHRVLTKIMATPEEFRLTWRGHEFLEASRNDTTWDEAKAKVFRRTGGIAFDVLMHVLNNMAINAVGLS